MIVQGVGYAGMAVANALPAGQATVARRACNVVKAARCTGFASTALAVAPRGGVDALVASAVRAHRHCAHPIVVDEACARAGNAGVRQVLQGWNAECWHHVRTGVPSMAFAERAVASVPPRGVDLIALSRPRQQLAQTIAHTAACAARLCASATLASLARIVPRLSASLHVQQIVQAMEYAKGQIAYARAVS